MSPAGDESAWFRFTGAQPVAILPATTPAMAAAGPKAEFDRDRALFRGRVSCAVVEKSEADPFSPVGVGGMDEFLDPLRARAA